MNRSIIRIGSRDSQLAIKQAQIVMDLIHRAQPDLQLELVTMKTTGDRILDRRLDQIGGKGLFVKELDQALREGRIDLSVHSLKDMPMEIPEDLPLMAFTEREDPRDVLICHEEIKEETLQKGGIIGSSSQRRILQLQKLYPNCEFRSIRGNVQTRLRKLKEEGYSATVLALAGIRRLGLEQIIRRYFTVEEILPAAGQGIIAGVCQANGADQLSSLTERSLLRKKLCTGTEWRLFFTNSGLRRNKGRRTGSKRYVRKLGNGNCKKRAHQRPCK